MYVPLRKELRSIEDEEMTIQKPLYRQRSLSLKREEFKQLQDMPHLVRHFAFWLSGAGDRYVSEKNFEQDLADGVALCSIMSKIHGSGVVVFHKVAPIGGLKAKENFITFQVAAKRLNLPIAFGLDDLYVHLLDAYRKLALTKIDYIII